MIHVVAILTAKPGMRDAVLEAFRAVMPAVHAEPGCIEYQPVLDAESAGAFQTLLGADVFIVIEKWQSMAALQAHGRSPHMASYNATTRDLVANAAIHVLTAA